jgi:membrane-associated protein
MLRYLSAWQKNVLRLLAVSGAIAVVWAISQDVALAQHDGVVSVVEAESEGFFGPVFRSILTFDTKGLMRTLSRPEYYIAAFIVLNVIVFVETGLLVGFFLPGDSLLVITGLLCANRDCQWNLPLLLATLSLSAIAGDTVGYWIGYTTGPKIFSREKSFFFAKDHLLKAQQFYDKHGGKTIILARFVPFLRTFAPVVAGVGRMQYRQFLLFNVVGGISWVFSMVLAGRYLLLLFNPLVDRIFGLTGDDRFHVEDHIEKVVIVVVFLSVLPIIYGWIKNKLTHKGPTPQGAEREEALVGK